MKKALLLVSILAVSVITTACINNLAVQELNTKAVEFIEQGNYNEAIERLKSSIDLDSNIYETHYNLGVAYTKNEDYMKALESYEKAKELKPDFADIYYSIAITEENLVTDLSMGNLILDDAGNIQKPESDEDDEQSTPKKLELNDVTTEKIKSLMEDAITNYEQYLAKSKDAKDIEDVEQKINDLKTRLDSMDKKAE